MHAWGSILASFIVASPSFADHKLLKYSRWTLRLQHRSHLLHEPSTQFLARNLTKMQCDITKLQVIDTVIISATTVLIHVLHLVYQVKVGGTSSKRTRIWGSTLGFFIAVAAGLAITTLFIKDCRIFSALGAAAIWHIVIVEVRLVLWS